MTLNLRLTPEIELHLTQRAEQKGISVEAYTLEILTEYLFKKDKQSSYSVPDPQGSAAIAIASP